jgi:hypothetical protein
VRDESWAQISQRTDSQNPSPPHYPVVENGKWVLSGAWPGLVNGKYDRYLIFEKVSRNPSDQIVSSGGTDDPGTRRVIARATTTSRTVELISYLTDFQSFIPRSGESVAISYEGAATDADLANFPSDNSGNCDPGQSFTTLASSVKVSKVSLFLRRITALPSDIYLELRPSPTASPIGTSAIVSAATISGAAASWVDFRFSDPVPLAAISSYIIRLRSIPDSAAASSGSSGTVHWLYTQTALSPYSGGTARRYIGRLSSPSDAGEELNQYDFGFKICALQ